MARPISNPSSPPSPLAQAKALQLDLRAEGSDSVPRDGLGVSRGCIHQGLRVFEDETPASGEDEPGDDQRRDGIPVAKPRAHRNQPDEDCDRSPMSLAK